MARRTTAILATAALVLSGTYVALDIADVVPGVLTTGPDVSYPEPFPTIDSAPQFPGVSAASDPLPTTSVTSAVDAFMEDERMGGATAVTVIDAATGDVLERRNATAAVPPASSTKILTAAAALSQIDPTSRIATTAMLNGDRVTLVGGGDILLTTGTPEPGNIVQASLTDLAARTARGLEDAGITEVSIAVDDSLFEERGYASTWGEYDYRHVMPISSLAVNGGLIERNLYQEDPAINAAEIFAAELESYGVVISGDPVRARAPEGSSTLAAVRSATIEEIVRYMMKASDNSVSEVLGFLTASAMGLPTTFEGSLHAVEEAIGELGIDTSMLVLHDVCGLSNENEITSDVLAQTVYHSLSDPSLGSLVSSFPVAYLDGTLTGRGADSAGFVRAKTGTLSHVVSLTGIVQTDSGGLLVFSAIAYETANNWEARQGIDAFASALRAAE